MEEQKKIKAASVRYSCRVLRDPFSSAFSSGIDMKEKKKRNEVDGERTNRDNWGVMRAERHG